MRSSDGIRLMEASSHFSRLGTEASADTEAFAFEGHLFILQDGLS